MTFAEPSKPGNACKEKSYQKRSRILIFDEDTSGLNVQTTEQFARTINGLKRKVTMAFITHTLSKGLLLDQVIWVDKQDLRQQASLPQRTVMGES